MYLLSFKLFRPMSPFPTQRTRSPNFQSMVRSRSPARTPPSLRPRSHSAIRASHPILNALSSSPNFPTPTNIQATVGETKTRCEFAMCAPNSARIAKNSSEQYTTTEKQNECKSSRPNICENETNTQETGLTNADKEKDGESGRIEICVNETNVQDTGPRSISPITERSWRSPMPTFKLGSTGHVTSGSVSSAPGSITPLGSRRILDSTTIQEQTKTELTRTSSNASNLSNLSQSAQEMFMSISSDLTGLATQSTYAFDEFFGIDQG